MKHCVDSHMRPGALDDVHGHDDDSPYSDGVAEQCYSILRPFSNPM